MSVMTIFNRFTFDTLDFVKRLEAAGLKPEIAEVQVQLQIELQKAIIQHQEETSKQVLDKFMEYQPLLDEIKTAKGDFATKSDMLMLETKIDGLRKEIRGEIRELRGEVYGEIKSLRSEMHGEIKSLRSEMKNLRNELLIKLGGIVVACSTGIATMIGFMGH